MPIKEQLAQVIEYSQGVRNPDVDDLYTNWLTAKRKFIDAFGNKLIYQYPEKVNFELTPSEKEARINDFVERVETYYGNYSLSRFIEKNKDGFFDNITVLDCYGSWDEKFIKKGSKLVRAFKHFEHHKETLTSIQNEASKIIQEDKVEGYLCLSVHPLDFLSLSENNHNWRTCHSLDGDYCAGNLSYMQDESTFICYLKSDKEDEKIPHFPFSWNSKKWRVLLYLSLDNRMIFAGRQYPFVSQNGLNFVLQKVINNVFNYFPASGYSWGQKWYNNYIEHFSLNNKGKTINLDSKYVVIGKSLISLRNLVGKTLHPLHYNDLIYSSIYEEPFYVYYAKNDYTIMPTGRTSISSTKFDIGKDVKCLKCGKSIVIESLNVICDDCIERLDDYLDSYKYCGICGRRILNENSYFNNEYEHICKDCWWQEGEKD